MKITWIGHSCFKIETNGYTIILDPYSDGSVPGYAPVREKANMVLCSHGHGDHNAVQCIELEAKDHDSVKITKIESFHDDQQGKQRGMNTIHIIDDGECKAAHLGDLGCGLDEEQIKLLSGMDVVMIPVGGFYTIDAAEASKIISQIHPKMVIPMHYSNDSKPSFGYNVLDSVSVFVEKWDNETLPVSYVDSNNIPAQIVVLQPNNSKG